jgi:hypothetical protein
MSASSVKKRVLRKKLSLVADLGWQPGGQDQCSEAENQHRSREVQNPPLGIQRGGAL